jgi:hypothetical protein
MESGGLSFGAEMAEHPKDDEHYRGERLQIMLDPAELKVLDDFRFANRMPSRAAAVRELLRRGLTEAGHDIEIAGAKSEEFGVLSPPQSAGDRHKDG